MNRTKHSGYMGILIFLTGFVQAQTAYDAIHILEREEGFGTRAMAMGGAYAGLANDYTAIYWNPAGLGTIQKSEFFTELSHMNYTNNALYAQELTLDNQAYTRFRSIGLAIPFPTTRGSFVIAMGYNRILDFDENLIFSGFSNQSNGLGFQITDENDATGYYPFDKDVNRFERVSIEGGLHQWSFGAALALSPHFMMGVTAARISGREEYRLHFNQTDDNNIYNQYPADFNQYKVNQYLQSDYSAWSLKIGGLIQLTKGLKIGGTMTLPTGFLIEEVHSSNDELTFDDGYVDATEKNGGWDYEVTTPYYFDGGLSYTSRFLTVAASARYRDWSQTRFKIPKNQLGNIDYREFLEENDQINQGYRPTMEYHLGGELNLPVLRTKLRSGYAFYPSPLNLKNSDLNQDRMYLTGGVSFTIDQNVHFDVTYRHGTWKRETSDSFTPSGTIENITDEKVIIGFSYEF